MLTDLVPHFITPKEIRYSRRSIMSETAGVSRISKTYDKSCFKFSHNLIRMTFPKFIGGQANEILLTERQKEVLEIIKENPAISRSQLALKLGVNESAIQKHIDALKQKGAIAREGENTGFWKILTD